MLDLCENAEVPPVPANEAVHSPLSCCHSNSCAGHWQLGHLPYIPSFLPHILGYSMPITLYGVKIIFFNACNYCMIMAELVHLSPMKDEIFKRQDSRDIRLQN